jgi:alpha-tubulin suppressor-like RCC1 family protein
MSVSVGKLVDQVNSKILAGGQDAINTARLVGAVEAIESRYSVANLAALPPAADNTGRFIYVEDIEAYRYSDGTQWTNNYDTTANVTNGQLWAWGFNGEGRLGNGTITDFCSPVREFCSADNWRVVSGGRLHTAAIKNSGELWSWGRGADGRLGDGTNVAKCSPVREFCSATDWCQVSAGGYHAAAVKTSGQLWAWGSGNSGRLGDGSYISRCSPVREFCSATNWCQVSSGTTSTIAIKTSGEIWSWGGGSSGILGDGTSSGKCSPVREFCSATDWCQVSIGQTHVIAIKTSGQLWAWGSNTESRLGDGTETNSCSPIREFCSATDWCQASSGLYHSIAIKTSGQIWGWGRNTSGQLGDGTYMNKCSPVREICSATDWCQVSGGGNHSAAVKTSNQIWAWGNNNCGRLGNGATINSCSPVREFSSSTDWCQVGAGASHTAAVKLTRGFNEP